MCLELHVITTLTRNYVFRTTRNYDFKRNYVFRTTRNYDFNS